MPHKRDIASTVYASGSVFLECGNGNRIVTACKNKLCVFEETKEDSYECIWFNEQEGQEDITSLALSNEYILVAYKNKRLKCFSLAGKEEGNIEISRKAVKVLLHNGQAFLADRYGDIYRYNVPKLDDPVDLLGHLSVVSDFIVVPMDADDTKSFIVSADLQSMLRRSPLHNTQIINRFYLGDQQPITAIASLTAQGDRYLVSAGINQCIALWRFTDGKKLHDFDVTNFVVDMLEEDQQTNSSSSSALVRNEDGGLTTAKQSNIVALHMLASPVEADLFAISFEGTSSVFIIRVQNAQLVFVKSFALNSVPFSMIFRNDGALWAVTRKEKEWTVQSWTSTAGVTTLANLSGLVQSTFPPVLEAVEIQRKHKLRKVA